MPVPTLEAIIISETIRRKWRFPLVAHGLGLIQSKGWTKNRKIQVDRAITESTEWYLAHMAKHQMPSYLQQRWEVTFNGVVREALNFLLALTKNVVPEPTADEIDDLMVFADMVVFSQNCTVDAVKTILAVLESRKMGIMFGHNFMLNHLVMKEDLLSLLAKLNAQLSDKEKYRAPKIISKEREQLENAHSQIAYYCDIKELAARNNNNRNSKEHFLSITDSLNESRHCELLEHWMELCCPSEQDLIEVANEVFESFDIKYRRVPPELAKLLLEYLTKEKLLEATKAPPKAVFRSLAGSWRSRHHCAAWLRLLLPRLDARECGALLAQLCSHLEEDRLQVTQLLTHMWKTIPDNHKNDEVMRKNISCLLSIHNFQKGVVVLLKDYDSEKANEMLMLSLQECLRQSKPNTQALRTLVWEMKKLFGNQSEVHLKESQLKMLLDVRRKAIFTPLVLDELLALTCGDGETLKSSLTADLQFIRSVLNKNWGEENTWTFLYWLMEYDRQAVADFLCRMESSLLQPLFSKKVHSCLPSNAAAGLIALRRDPRAAFAAALRDANVRARLAGRLLEAAANSSFNPQNWEILWSYQGTLRSLLLSAEGKRKIRSIGTKYTSYSSSGANFSNSHLNILIQCQNICNYLLRPNGLCAQVGAYLAESGHPNAASAGVLGSAGGSCASGSAGDSGSAGVLGSAGSAGVSGNKNVSGSAGISSSAGVSCSAGVSGVSSSVGGAGSAVMAMERQLVDFRYRALRALLARDLALPQLAADGRVRLPAPAPREARAAPTPPPPPRTMTATEVSVALAEMAQLAVPVVI